MRPITSVDMLRWLALLSTADFRPMRSTQEFLRYAIELRSEFFHCGIFADNFAGLSTVQSYLCGD
jgi:hypothetical protein